jgi:hypothetical protein
MGYVDIINGGNNTVERSSGEPGLTTATLPKSPVCLKSALIASTLRPVDWAIAFRSKDSPIPSSSGS